MGGRWERYSPYQRIRQEFRYAALAARATSELDPEVYITCNVPLFASARLHQIEKRKMRPQVYWLQDLYSVGISSAVWSRSSAIGRAISPALWDIEANLLRSSSAVVAITEDFLPVLASWHVDLSRVQVVPNWAPIEELPARPKDNSWAKRHNYHDVPVVLYAGTLGLKHDSQLLLALAAHLEKHTTSARVVVVSEGPTADRLVQSARNAGLERLDVIPFQPWEEMPDVLGSADVLVAVLSNEAGIFSVPSKISTYLCSCRPVVAAVPTSNLSARIIRSVDAGLVVDQRDPADFCAAVASLLKDPERGARLGSNGREFAETSYRIDHVARRFEELLESVLGRP